MMLTIQLIAFLCLGVVFAQKLRVVGLGLLLAVVCGFHALTASGDLLSTLGKCVSQVIMIQLGFVLGVWARAVIAPMFLRTARAS